MTLLPLRKSLVPWIDCQKVWIFGQNVCKMVAGSFPHRSKGAKSQHFENKCNKVEKIPSIFCQMSPVICFFKSVYRFFLVPGLSPEIFQKFYCLFFPNVVPFAPIMTSFFSSLSDLDHSKGAGSDGRLILLALVLKLVLTCSSIAPREKHTPPRGALDKFSDRTWERLGHFSCVHHTHTQKIS